MTKLTTQVLNTFKRNEGNSVLHYSQNTQEQLQELNEAILELGAHNILPQFMEAKEGFVSIEFTKIKCTDDDNSIVKLINKQINNKFVTESYNQALESLNEAIKNMQDIQNNTKNSSEEYREALQNQVTLEKTKLALIQNELINKKPVFGF